MVESKSSMVLRSDNYDHPMRFERAVNLLLYALSNSI